MSDTDPEEVPMTVQEIVADLVDQVQHADALIEEQAQRIETLEAEVALLRNVFGFVAV